MEGDDRISDDALARSDEETSTQSESDYSEQDVGNIPTRKHTIHIEGTKEKEEREKRTADERVDAMEKAVKGFRIASSGDGLLRGTFGKLNEKPRDIIDRVKNLIESIDKFNLTGDNLNVSGSFDKGYTVSRENPCQQEQANSNPT